MKIILENLFKKYIDSSNLKEAEKTTKHILKHIITTSIENKEIQEAQIKSFVLVVLYKRQLKTDENSKSKDIFANTILNLYNFNPNLILYFIKLDVLSEYGYYKDYLNIWRLVCIKFNKANSLEEEKKIYFKYNKLINIISDCILEQRSKDLEVVNKFLIKLNFYNHWSYFGIDGIINNDSINRISHLKLFIKNLKTDEFKRVFKMFQNVGNTIDSLNLSNYDINNSFNTISLDNFPEIPISKVSMWIPREDKKINKNIFWFKNYNQVNNISFNANMSMSMTTTPNTDINEDEDKDINYNINSILKKKINCYEFLVSKNKLKNNLSDLKVYGIDKKRFRIENSVLNAFLETPQQDMCFSNLKDIDFKKVGSKFIYKNKNYLLNKNTKLEGANTTTQIKNIFKKNIFYYEYDRQQTRNNLINYYIKNQCNRKSEKKQPIIIEFDRDDQNLDNNKFSQKSQIAISKYLNKIYSSDILTPVRHYLEFFFSCQ